MSHPVVNNKVFCIWIKNTLQPVESSLFVTLDCTGERVNDYICSFVGELAENQNILVHLNNRVLAEDENPVLLPEDRFCFCVLEGDRKFIGIIGAVVLTVVATALYQQWSYPLIWGALLGVGVGMVLYGFTPMPALPGMNQGSLEDGANNYGWTSGINPWQEGMPLPSLIGSRWYAPPRIAAYRHLPDGDPQQQHLKLQFALHDGVIDPLTEEDIVINGKPLADFPGARWEYSQGLPEETKVSSLVPATATEQHIGADLPEVEEVFNEVKNLNILEGYSNRVSLNVTEETDNITLEIEATFLGFFPVEKVVGYDEYGIPSSVEYLERDLNYRLHVRCTRIEGGTPVEKTFSTDDIAKSHKTGWAIPVPWALSPTTKTVYSLLVDNLVPGTYTVEIWRENGESNYSARIIHVIAHGSLLGQQTYTTNGTEITRVGLGLLFPEGLYYYDAEGNIQNHTVTLVCRLREYGETDWKYIQYLTVTDNSTKPFRRFFEFLNLPQGKWEVLPLYSGIMPADMRYKHRVHFEFIQEGIEYKFSYPGVATLSLDLPAVESFNERWPTVLVKPRKSDFTVERSSGNPAWEAYYRLIGRYEVDSDDVPVEKFSTWADFCDANNLTCNFIIDNELSMREVLDVIGQAGRATVFQRGKNWDVVIDTQRTPRYTFGSDNIEQGSFVTKWISNKEKANSIIAYYFDKDDFNNKKPVKVVHPSVDAGLIRPIEREITFIGVDTRDQAVQIAIVMLNQTTLAQRTMQWRSFVDAIGCSVGEVAYLQNDHSVFGLAPGRAQEATSSSVVCDLPLDFSDGAYDGRNLRLLVRHQTPRVGETDDFIEVHPIVNPYPNTDVLTYNLSGGATFERTPVKDSLVLIGWVVGQEESTEEELLSVKKVLITGIERYSDKKFTVSAIDYYDDSFISDYVVIDEPPKESGLSVDNVHATPSWVLDGRVRKNYIELIWGGVAAQSYFIFYQTEYPSGWSEWKFYAEVHSNYVRISDLPSGFNYKFSISLIRSPDLNPANCVEIYYEFVDFSSDLVAIQNLRCFETGTSIFLSRDLGLVWDAYVGFTFSRYRIEILNELSEIIRIEYTIQTRFSYTYEMNIQDNGGVVKPDVRVRIVVEDDVGNEAAGSIIVFSNAVPGPPINLRLRLAV